MRTLVLPKFSLEDLQQLLGRTTRVEYQNPSTGYTLAWWTAANWHEERTLRHTWAIAEMSKGIAKLYLPLSFYIDPTRHWILKKSGDSRKSEKPHITRASEYKVVVGKCCPLFSRVVLQTVGSFGQTVFHRRKTLWGHDFNLKDLMYDHWGVRLESEFDPDVIVDI